MLSVLNASYNDEYKILLEFSDNKKGVVDLKEFILNGKIKQFQVDYTLKWNDNLDLAPEYLYFKTFENDDNLQDKFQKWGYI